MKISNIKPYYLDTVTAKNNKNQSVNKSRNYAQHDVLFRSGYKVLTDSNGEILQKQAKAIFSNPKYKISAETFKDVLNFIGKIKNKYQLNYIENILSHNIERNHPIIRIANLNKTCHGNILKTRINSEKELDAKNYAFDFLMKHPDIITDETETEFLLYYSTLNNHKKYLEFIDKNYETITEKLNISKRNLMRSLVQTLSETKYEYESEKYEHIHEYLWNVVMEKIPLESIPTDPQYSNLIKSSYHVYNDDYEQNWYFKTDTAETERHKTASDLIKTANKNKIGLHIEPRDLAQIIYFDKKISIPELLFINMKYESYNSQAKFNYMHNLIEAYRTPVQNDTSLTRTGGLVDYNKYNRKFLWYVANVWMDGEYGYNYNVKNTLLQESVLKRINTQEKLDTMIKFYNEFCDNNTPLKLSEYRLSILMDNNLCTEDLLKLNKLYIDDKEIFDKKIKKYLY